MMAETIMSAGPRVKICGIRSKSDLKIAVDSGADAVGFISGSLIEVRMLSFLELGSLAE
jgi:phosphoribosylanthranilate isomerase